MYVVLQFYLRIEFTVQRRNGSIATAIEEVGLDVDVISECCGTRGQQFHRR